MLSRMIDRRILL